MQILHCQLYKFLYLLQKFEKFKVTGSVAAPFTPFRDNGYATKFSMNRMQSKQHGESKKYCL